MRKIVLWNRAHIGDCIILLHYLKRVVRRYERDVQFDVYVNVHNLGLQKYAAERITLLDDLQRPWNAIDTWIGRDDPWFLDIFSSYERYYANWFKRLSIKLGLPDVISSSMDMLHDDRRIVDNYIGQVGSPTALVINSLPMSNQVDTSPSNMEMICQSLEARGHQVITTAPTPNRPCTLDYNLDLFGIARVSTQVEVVVGIMTGPIHMCFNVWSIHTVKAWLTIENMTGYTYLPSMLRAKSTAEALQIVCSNTFVR